MVVLLALTNFDKSHLVMSLFNFNLSSKNNNNNNNVVQSIFMNNYAITTSKRSLYMFVLCSISYRSLMMRLAAISLRFKAS